MNGALYSVVSGSLAAARRLEITANNLANANTSGFKAQQLVVGSRRPGVLDVPVPPGESVGVPGRTAVTTAHRTVTDLSQGAIRESGNPLDLAIAGPGIFVVTTPNGERYTRQGQFELDATGRLVTSSGNPVQNKEGDDITLPPGRIEIAADGRISVTEGNISVKPTERATLRLVRFLDSEAVIPEGGTLFRARAGAGVVDADPGETQLIQGSIEDANVDVIKGLLQIIEVARGYDAYMQAMRKVDGSVEIAIRQVGGRG